MVLRLLVLGCCGILIYMVGFQHGFGRGYVVAMCENLSYDKGKVCWEVTK